MKKKKQLRLGLKTQFITWFLILSLIPMLAVGFITFSLAKQELIAEGKDRLQKSTNIAYEKLVNMNFRVLKNEITLEEAQEILRTQLIGVKQADGSRIISSTDLVIGNDDYLYAFNSDAQVVMHPFKESPKKSEDPNVLHIVEQKEGFYTYEGRVEPDDPLRTKIVYMRYFEPWDWIIVNGSWEENFYKGINEIGKLLIIIFSSTVVVVILFALIISRKIVKPINELSDTMVYMGDGDFTKQPQIKSRDELGILSASMNKSMNSISKVIDNVRLTSHQLASSAEQLNVSATETNNIAKEVALAMDNINTDLATHDKNVESISGLMEELAASYEEVSASTDEVSKRAYQTEEAGNEGSMLVENMTNQIRKIEESVINSANRIQTLQENSNEIGKIVNLISEISSQTNLLALNAAIEAARAGENGRGFAVVADEVRNLAEQTARATEQIKKLIGNIQSETKETVVQFDEATKAVNKGIEYVEQTGNSFKIILNSIVNVSSGLNEVSTAISEMASGTNNAVEDINDIAQVSNEISERSNNLKKSAESQVFTSDSIAQSAHELSEMAEQLQDLLSSYKTM
ncbi:MAG: methyl-accepting chemotaxis protein [Vulcanibacillus sp.]